MAYFRPLPQGGPSKADLRAEAEAALAAWRAEGRAPVVIPAEGENRAVVDVPEKARPPGSE